MLKERRLLSKFVGKFNNEKTTQKLVYYITSSMWPVLFYLEKNGINVTSMAIVEYVTNLTREDAHPDT